VWLRIVAMFVLVRMVKKERTTKSDVWDHGRTKDKITCVVILYASIYLTNG